MELYNGKKTTTVDYAYDADGNLVSETAGIALPKAAAVMGTAPRGMKVPQATVITAAVPPETATPPMRKRITARTSAAFFSR
ncbi:MAG: hypothetical protein K2G20_03330 [Lachnospiraceae bacterium]|nr:hypothetical protein [Lachnospiraceae bacterium]